MFDVHVAFHMHAQIERRKDWKVKLLFQIFQALGLFNMTAKNTCLLDCNQNINMDSSILASKQYSVRFHLFYLFNLQHTMWYLQYLTIAKKIV